MSEEDSSNEGYKHIYRHNKRKNIYLSDEDSDESVENYSTVKMQKFLHKHNNSEEKNKRTAFVDRHNITSNTSSKKKNHSNLQPSINNSEIFKNITSKKIVQLNKEPLRRDKSPVDETDETQDFSETNSKFIKLNSFSQIFTIFH